MFTHDQRWNCSNLVLFLFVRFAASPISEVVRMLKDFVKVWACDVILGTEPSTHRYILLAVPSQNYNFIAGATHLNNIPNLLSLTCDVHQNMVVM